MSDLKHTVPASDDGAIKSPDGRFYAWPARDGRYYVKDEKGFYFIGGGKVSSRATADSTIGVWTGKLARGER